MGEVGARRMLEADGIFRISGEARTAATAVAVAVVAAALPSTVARACAQSKHTSQKNALFRQTRRLMAFGSSFFRDLMCCTLFFQLVS